MTWQGDLLSGSGTIERVGSGAFAPLAVTWAARAEDESGGKTSPEELIAAAHASCFSMALRTRARAGGHAARAARDLGTRHVRRRAPGSRRSRSRCAARVPGLDEDGFRAAAEDAKDGCPVSKALAGVPEITVDATLERLVRQQPVAAPAPGPVVGALAEAAHGPG